MLKVGLVGLPNAGKSTLFNALVQGNQADVGNFPFCTIDPNVGIVDVPDERLAQLAAICNPKKVIPAVVEFVDIAGLVAGASEGQGLGNKFLSHIKEVDAIIFVLRAFSDDNIIHVEGSVDPIRDFQTLMLELTLADLSVVASAHERAQRAAHDGKPDTKARADFITEIKRMLDQNRPASDLPDTASAERQAVLKELQLLTAKPRLVVFNIHEQDAADPLANPTIKEWLKDAPAPELLPQNVLFVSAQIESELINLEPADREIFLGEYGLKEPGMNRLITTAYRILKLQSFLTAGPDEVRAWTIPIGATAPEAGGVIHTDFYDRFIRAEVIAFADFITYGGETGARDAGRLRSEGREYVVHDGDVLHIRFAPK